MPQIDPTLDDFEKKLTSAFPDGIDFRDKQQVLRLAFLPAESQRLAVEKYFDFCKYSQAGSSDFFTDYQLIRSFPDTVKIELLKKIAHQHGLFVSKNIQNYGITDPKAIFEIAMIVVTNPSFSTLNQDNISQYIQNYGIKSEKDLLEIAKAAAIVNGYAVARAIQCYQITNQEFLVEIAKIAAAHGDISSYIQNFKITDQKSLIEIAKIAAANDGEKLSLCISSYRIINPEALIEIAKIAAANSDVSLFIKNYGITNPEVLIEIAKISAAQDGKSTSKYIQNYGITNPEALIEIAKIAAAQDGKLISKYIQNYGITNPEALIEIAKMAAAQNGYMISKYIRNYGITSPEALIEIAKIAAANPFFGKSISSYIQNYGITNPEALIEIAKIAADNDRKISQHIQKYGITDEKSLIEIAKIAAAKYAHTTSKYIQNYEIRSSQSLIEVAKIAAGQIGLEILYYIKLYKIEEATTFHNDLAEIIINRISSTLNFKNQLTQLILELIKLRNPDLKKNIISILKNVLKRPDKLSRFLSLYDNFEQDQNRKGKSTFAIPALILSSIGITPELNDLVNDIKLVFFSNSISKNALSLQTILKPLALLSLPREKSCFNAEQILCYLFRRVGSKTSPSTVVNKCYFLNSLLFFEGLRCLKSIDSQLSDYGLEDKVYEIFKEKIHLTRENLNKYYATVNCPANEKRELHVNIMTYLSKHLNNPQMPALIKQFIEYLYDKEKFYQNRYDPETNPHLKKIFETHTEIFQKWKQKIAFKGVNSCVITDDPVDLFLIGTEVVGSCQDVGGEPSTNYCLMSYVLDGKIKAVALKDPITGKIIARSILRLLWDKVERHPVLFFEESYSIPNPALEAKWESELIAQATAYARELNVPLLATNKQKSPTSTTYPNDVESLGGSVPFEYVDALKGPQDSEYTIPSDLTVRLV